MHAGLYNFNLADSADQDYHALYTVRRRDALFAFAIPQPDGSVILGRDHLGNVPLFYRNDRKEVSYSLFLGDLLTGDETTQEEGLRTYLAIGTLKLAPLFKEVHSVPPGTVVRAYPDGRTDTLYEYQLTPRRLGGWSFTQCVDETDRLLVQATRRTLKEKRVGLYLSGGIDSALTGIYLKKAGAQVHGYTAAPWGAASEEARLAALNAKIIGTETHTIRALNTEQYAKYADDSLGAYGNPNGAPSQIGVLCIQQETPLPEERQIYFGQNTDTMTCSVPDQSLVYFTSLLPRLMRERLHPALRGKSDIDMYTSFRTSGLVSHFAPLARFRAYTPIERITCAGMFFGHTPVDGEIMSLPAIRSGQIVSNLYYDMDLIEFAMGIPRTYRLEWGHGSKIGIAFGKRIFKALARRYLPSEIVDRKKGFTVPVNRDDRSRAFFESLPTQIAHLKLSLPNQRFAAEMLRRWSLMLAHPPQSLQNLYTPPVQDPTPIPCSVGILTRNSAATLERALRSLQHFSDLIICDGGSTDETLTIARKFGARIITQDTTHLDPKGAVADFAGVRNQMLRAATHDWFLYIDSDEYLSAEASSEIGSIVRTPLKNDSPRAFWLPRKTVIKGTVIECATAYPNYQMRFFHKSAVTGFIKRVHERIQLKDGVSVAKLHHPEYVPLDLTPKEMRQKQLYYLQIEVDRHQDNTFKEWLMGPAYGALRSSLSYLVRHVRIALFCRGARMPLWVEWMHHWYNWKLLTMTGSKFFKRRGSSPNTPA